SIRNFLAHTTSSIENYEATRSAFKIYDPACDMLSTDAVRSKLEELTGVYALYDDLCINSCIAYTGPYSELETCPVCEEPRYQPDSTTPRNKMTTIPIGPQLQAMHRHEQTAEQLDYWASRTHDLLQQLERGEEILEYFDVMCGSDILKLMTDGHLTPDDTVIMHSIDGAQLYRHKKSNCWMSICVIFNFAPDQGRYKVSRVLPVSTVPGPEKPKIMESVIYTSLHHISAVNRRGGLPIWDAYRASRRYRDSGLFSLFATADAEALPIYNSLVGPTGKFGCRLWCPLCGRRMSGGRRGGHYYPMMALPNDYACAGCDHDDVDYHSPLGPRSQDDYLDVLEQICAVDMTQKRYAELRRDTGVAKQSPLLGLWVSPQRPMILGLPGMCPLDSMHMVMNLAKAMLSLWTGSIDCLPTDDRNTWDWMVLVDDVWKQHGLDVEACKEYSPSSFERVARNIAEKLNSGYKAIEFLNYFFVHGPALLYRVLPMVYWVHYCKLVAAIRMLCQKSVLRAQIDEAAVLLQEFLEEFETLYIQRREDRMHFITQVIHNLWHLAPETLRVGPISLYAQWTLERTIGNLTEEMKQPGDPYQNLAQRSLRRAWTNALKAFCPVFDEKRDIDARVPRGGLLLQNGYTLLPARDRYSRIMTVQDEIDAIESYLSSLLVEPERPLEREDIRAFLAKPKIQRWGGLRLPNGQKARCCWSQDRIKSSKKRDTVNVKVDANSIAFARVRFFCQMTVGEQEHTVAMVEYFRHTDMDLLRQSSGALTTVTLTGRPEDLEVVHYSRICSVITAPPCP
ncbi:hypothetical protein EXIGLDRAFT_593834, partial [Exidia glandulosa HHB12029]